MSELPTGTVTFFFSDIEGSTRLIQRLGEGYPNVLLAHHTVLREALAANGGHELRTEGDSFFIVFDSALQACAGAAAAQRALYAHPWPEGGTIRVVRREQPLNVSTGEANETPEPTPNRPSQVAATYPGIIAKDYWAKSAGFVGRYPISGWTCIALPGWRARVTADRCWFPKAPAHWSTTPCRPGWR